MKKVIQKVSEITNGIQNRITGKEEELAQKRMKICLECPDRKVSSFMPDRCGICGCILEYKTRSVKSSCPKGHWVIVLLLSLSLFSCNKKSIPQTIVIHDTVRHVKDIIIPKDSVVLIQRISELKDTVVKSERVILATKIINGALVIEAECPEIVVKDTSYVITTNKVTLERGEENLTERILLFILIAIIVVVAIKSVMS
jgi:hypothetical protein